MVEIITIDGPASSGKSTLAKKISIYYSAPLLSSGKLYRSIALEIKNKKIDTSDKKRVKSIINKLQDFNLNSKNLFLSDIDKIASKISSKKYIRDRLKKYQREFPNRSARNAKYVIIEGRDIGTEIFPNARYKIFMWADAKVRAKRRFEQITKNGQKVSLRKVYSEIVLRDSKDLNRKIAPLKPAVNSVLLDTTYLDIEQTFNVMNTILK